MSPEWPRMMKMRKRWGINGAKRVAALACLLLLLSAKDLIGGQHHGAALPQNNAGGPGFLHQPLPSAGHLPDWLAHHQNLPMQEQEKLLQRNREFSQLTPQAQQRIMDQLHRIDRMPVAQRQRYLARNEAMERLTPTERTAFNESLHAVSTLPPERRAALSEAFRHLRQYPIAKRKELLRSAPYTDSLNDQERAILENLLRVEPYLPPPTAPAPVAAHP